MPLKTFGSRTFAALAFGAVTLHGVDVCGGLRTFAPATFGSHSFRSNTLHGVCDETGPAPEVIIPHGSASKAKIRHAKKSLPPIVQKIQRAVEIERIDYRQQDADILQIIMLFVTEMDK